MGKRATSGEGSATLESWYEILEVEIDASQDAVENAYRRALKLVDGSSVAGYQMLGSASTQEAIDAIEEAHAVLGNRERRQAYDVELGLSKPVERYTSGIPMDALCFLPPIIEEPPASVIELHPNRKQATDAVLPKTLLPKTPLPKTPLAPTASHPAESHSQRDAEAEAVSVRNADTIPMAPVGFELGEGEINGQVIRMAREHAGISLEDLARATKISKNYLHAIEDQDIERLPARVFLRGFLTQIARVLKLDKERLAQGYLAFSDRFQDK